MPDSPDKQEQITGPDAICANCGHPCARDDGACPACGEPVSSAAPSGRTAIPGEAETAGNFLPILIGILVLAAVIYRILVDHRLEQSAMLFIGLPGLIATLVALAPPARSSTGMITKVITLAMCLSGLFLGEGAVCILFALGPALLVGFVAGQIFDRHRARSGRPDGKVRVLVPLPLLVLLSLEGTSPGLSFRRAESVSASRIVHATPEQIAAALARPPDFSGPLPMALRIGFPRPVSASGGGLAPGDLRVIDFAGGEGKPGSLTLRVRESAPGRVRFDAVSDTSHIAHWLRWNASTVTWQEVSPGQCEVRWTVDYDRLLDPAWYFGPAERAAVELAAGCLIDNLATP